MLSPLFFSSCFLPFDRGVEIWLWTSYEIWLWNKLRELPFAVPTKAIVNLAVLKIYIYIYKLYVRRYLSGYVIQMFWARPKSAELDLDYLKHLASVLCLKWELYVRIIWELNFYTPLLEPFEVFGGDLYKCTLDEVNWRCLGAKRHDAKR